MRNSRRIWSLAAIAAAIAPALGAREARAFDMPPDSLLRAGGRFEYRVETAAVNSPFDWNYASRGAKDLSRLMLDLQAGRRPYGQLYLKGVAWWNVPRKSRGPRFRFGQGDYFWRHERERSDFSVRLFANERRYFTHELSVPMLVDGIVTGTGAMVGIRRPSVELDDQFGLRHDGTAGDAGWTALAAVLGDRWDEEEKFYFLRAGWWGSRVQASAVYFNSSPGPDTLENHAVVKGELSGGYRQFGAVVSYEQSGFDDSAFFIPTGDDGYGTGSSAQIDSLSGLDAGAVYAEFRMRRLRIGDTGLWSVIVRQRSTGDGYVDAMGQPRGGVDSRLAGLYYAALTKAIDARVEYKSQKHTSYDDNRWDRVVGMVRAQLVNGAETYLRGGYGELDDDLDDELPPAASGDSWFAHAAYRRNGRSVTTGLHGLFLRRDGAPDEGRFGVEARLNFTATVSLYGRLITTDRVGSRDDVFLRLDMRPTDWMFAAVGYGQFYIGNEPYMLEDPDIGRNGEAESVWFIRVRGDF